MGKWIFGLLFGGVASVFIVAGAFMAWNQHALVENAQPTRATITQSEVVTSTHHTKGRRRTSYSAKIAYEYTVSGQKRTGNDINPGGFTVSGESAHTLVAKFPQGKTVEAFYDKRDPDQAFLIKRHDFGPYLFILFPMIHLSIGLVVALGGSSKRLPPIEKGDGKWLLPTGMTTAAKFNKAAILAGVWWLVGGLAIVHFLRVSERPYDGFPLWASGIYLAIGLIPLWTAWHFWSLMNRVSDALVTTDIYPLRRGYPVRVNVKLDLAGGGNIETATATLVCRGTFKSSSGGKNRTSTNDVWKSEQTFAQPQDLISDRTIAGDVTFIPPVSHPASTPKGTRGYPRHEWELRLHIKRGGPDYKTKFSVEVI